jgi:electron transfer flavoprotein beta subunit
MVEVESPCLLTCLASAVKPRYMSVKGIVEAWDKEVEIWTEEKIDVSEEKLGLKGSPTKVKKAGAKEMKAAGQVHDGLSPEEAADLIIAKLKEKYII